MSEYLTAFDALMAESVFGLEQTDKNLRLLPILRGLQQLHSLRCSEFESIVGAYQAAGGQPSDTVVYLAVRLFKLLELKSISPDQVFKVLQSSGTTAQTPARIILDKPTSQRQSKVLVAILQQVLGKQRLPMLIIDAPSTVRDPSKFNARAAGIQGLAFFGRDHTYALNDDMSPNWSEIHGFCDKYAEQPVLLFGFTFMVWQYWLSALNHAGKFIHLPHGVLLHSGGWKKLEAQRVDNATFKQTVESLTGVKRCHNFYGMAEQVGSIFMECSEGYLHAPHVADVIVRDPVDLSMAGVGEQGLLQVLSGVPTSYPGHSILTEDLGVLHGEDDCRCGWKGKYFSVLGRLPKTEMRGCSDTHAPAVKPYRPGAV
ncbi:acyl-protein synthetase [Alteromonas sp. SM 2104]|nr:acyl-protein synthetase [Alteromonas oceanisediminis]